MPVHRKLSTRSVVPAGRPADLAAIRVSRKALPPGRQCTSSSVYSGSEGNSKALSPSSGADASRSSSSSPRSDSESVAASRMPTARPRRDGSRPARAPATYQMMGPGRRGSHCLAEHRMGCAGPCSFQHLTVQRRDWRCFRSLLARQDDCCRRLTAGLRREASHGEVGWTRISAHLRPAPARCCSPTLSRQNLQTPHYSPLPVRPAGLGLAKSVSCSSQHGRLMRTSIPRTACSWILSYRRHIQKCLVHLLASMPALADLPDAAAA